MCTNLHYIFNKHIRRRILVPCGHCPACLQQKADARTMRIRNHFNKEQTCLFVTLTYDNKFVPCVKHNEIKEFSYLNVYRGVDCSDVIERIYISELPKDFKPQLLPSVRSNNAPLKGIMSVCLYSDLQKFFKRLRINLKRNGINSKFQYFCCTEYGAAYKRSHAHILFFVDSDYVETFRTYIVKSWPFADTNRLCRSIEIAKHPASYVSSYVNCITSLPLFLQKGAFRPKHAASLDFGKNHHLFSLRAILSAADCHDFTYNVADALHFTGNYTLCFPKYVISRYFPIFKGYTRVASCQILNVLQRPALLATTVGNTNEYTNEDIHKIGVSLRNHFRRYSKDYYKFFGRVPSYDDYCIDFERVWREYNMTKLRMFYDDAYSHLRQNPLDCYDNCNEVYLGRCKSDLLDSHSLEEFAERDNYNSLPDRARVTKDLTFKFWRKDKQRKVTNHIYAHLSEVF